MSTEIVKTKPGNGSILSGAALMTDEEKARVHSGLRVNERDLDKAIKEIDRLRGDMVANGWHLGRQFVLLKDGQLWKQRKVDGEDRYRSFGDFCKAELGLSKQTVYKFIRIAETFTEEDATRIRSTEKMKLISAALMEAGGGKKLDLSVRNELVDAAQEKSLRQLRDHIVDAGLGKRRPVEPKAKVAAEVKAPKAKAGEITVAMMPGKKTITLLQKQKGKDGEYPPAKKFDGSWGWIDLANDVQLVFGVSQKGKKLCLAVEARRIE